MKAGSVRRRAPKAPGERTGDISLLGYLRLMAHTARIKEAQHLYHSFVADEERRLASAPPSSMPAPRTSAPPP